MIIYSFCSSFKVWVSPTQRDPALQRRQRGHEEVAEVCSRGLEAEKGKAQEGKGEPASAIKLRAKEIRPIFPFLGPRYSQGLCISHCKHAPSGLMRLSPLLAFWSWESGLSLSRYN